jgi:hypothetical protein
LWYDCLNLEGETCWILWTSASIFFCALQLIYDHLFQTSGIVCIPQLNKVVP